MEQKLKIAVITSVIIASVIIPITAIAMFQQRPSFQSLFFTDSVLVEENTSYLPGTVSYKINRYELEGKAELFGYDVQLDASTVYTVTIDGTKYAYYVAYSNIAYLVEYNAYRASAYYINQKYWPEYGMDEPQLTGYKLTTSVIASPSIEVSSLQLDLDYGSFYGIPVNNSIGYSFYSRCNGALYFIYAYPVIGGDAVIKSATGLDALPAIIYGYQLGTTTFKYAIFKVGSTWYRTSQLVQTELDVLLCVSTTAIMQDAKKTIEARDDFKAVEIIDKKLSAWSTIKTATYTTDAISIIVNNVSASLRLVSVPDSVIQAEMGESLYRKNGEPKVFCMREMISNAVLTLVNYGGRWYRSSTSQFVGLDFQIVIDGINTKQLTI